VRGVTGPSEIESRNESEGAVQSARSLQLIGRVLWLQNILAVNIISQKQEFNVLLSKTAKKKTNYIQIHIYTYEIVINPFEGCINSET
jgi:hypothetical protein